MTRDIKEKTEEKTGAGSEEDLHGERDRSMEIYEEKYKACAQKRRPDEEVHERGVPGLVAETGD